MAKALVIIPTYNEEATIAKLLTELLALPLELEVLVVDDGMDRTGEIINELGQQQPRAHLLKRQGKGGRGSAVLAGLRFGLERDFDYLVEMDADFSHQPKELPALLAAAALNKVVIGSRYVRGSKIVGWPLQRRIFSRLANIYANFILGIGIHDYTNGYRVYGRQAAQQLDMDKIKSSGYIVLSEIAYQLHRKGVEFVERPTLFINRQRGVSNFSLAEIKESFASVLRLRRDG